MKIVEVIFDPTGRMRQLRRGQAMRREAQARAAVATTWPTRKLLNEYRMHARTDPYLAKLLKQELDTREHIPNAAEAKKLRQAKARSKSRNKNR